jgi:SAM-dependent methyltransferase
LPVPPSQSRQARNDRYLEREIAGLVGNDRRLDGIGAVTIRIAGGVVHLGGSIRSEKDRSVLRQTVGMFRGVQAVWDLLEVRGRKPLVLDLGSGEYKQSFNAIGVDFHRFPCVDVIADLEQGLPFADRSVDHIFAVHILEHIHNLIGLMNDIHRVLSETGVLHVLTPFWHHSVAVADPTHVRFFGAETFKAFCSTKNGIKPYRPLAITSTEDSVLADLQPVKDGSQVDDDEILRFFP